MVPFLPFVVVVVVVVAFSLSLFCCCCCCCLFVCLFVLFLFCFLRRGGVGRKVLRATSFVIYIGIAYMM